ncbi:MAG: CrcB family protein [Acidimicrobiia bacterium]|nr:CrcB family protein [Acidimicrobiia bacterium]
MRTFFAVGLGGAIGSMARYAVGSLLGRREGWDYWMATMAVNVTGALALGILVGFFGDHVTDNSAVRTGLTVGLLGGYTTFSTWMVESMDLVGTGRIGAGVVNVVVAVVAGLAAAIAGLAIGRTLAV